MQTITSFVGDTTRKRQYQQVMTYSSYDPGNAAVIYRSVIQRMKMLILQRGKKETALTTCMTLLRSGRIILKSQLLS